MVVDGLSALPRWLLVGLGLGVVSSLLAACLFLVAHRRYPSPASERRRGDGDVRRRGEIRDYLDAIDESYAEEHVVDGQHVAFYLPERDVAITFDARAYYRLDRGDTDAVLVEHEMPGRQLGERLPFAVPDVAFGDPAADADPTASAFAELGVAASADIEEVRAAYRRRVKETHPDQGGDEAAFKRVREAYTTAKKHAG